MADGTETPDAPRSVREATRRLFERYRTLCTAALAAGAPPLAPADAPAETALPHLVWMCDAALASLDADPIDKGSRWLGYVQGVLVMRGLVTVGAERDFSRPLFHAAYRAEPHAGPATRAPTTTQGPPP